MKVLTIVFDEVKGLVNFYGNLSPDEAMLLLFKSAKSGTFSKKEKIEEPKKE